MFSVIWIWWAKNLPTLPNLTSTLGIFLTQDGINMNRWNIPQALENEIIYRDKNCVYCGVKFGICGTRKSKQSWEHIVNDERIITRENIALCCMSCNSSKGAKLLEDWLNSKYCLERNITKYSVAEVIKNALKNPPKLETKYT